MALRPSIALRNAMMESQSFKSAMANAVLRIYSGAQPATAEPAPTGSLLNTYSDAGGAVTREVTSAGSVTFSGSVGGSVSSITVNSIEILGQTITPVTSVSVTAGLVADAINDNPKNLLFVASTNAGKVIITAKRGLGALPNGWAVVSTVGTISKADVNMGTEVAGVTAVNGLKFGDCTGGVITKLPSQVWSGTAVAAGVAGWFRFEAGVLDGQALDSAEAIYRLDGTIANTGSDFNMTSTSVVSGISYTIASCAFTFPTA